MSKYNWKRLRSRALPLLIAFLIGISVGGIYMRGSLGKSPNDGHEFFGDRSLHVAGANYFQQQPWQYPLFDIEGYRFPEGGSVIYTDGIPILAALIKLTHPLHGQILDYFDWYFVICVGLQALLFVLLLREFKIDHWYGTLTGALLAACTPTLLYKHGHTALCSHFLIILALLLYLRSPKQGSAWTWIVQFSLLLLVALLVHPYLFFMVGIIFGTTYLRALQKRKVSIKQTIFSCAGIFAALIGFMHITGHIRSDVAIGNSAGFGKYSMNLISPIWPQLSGLAWWKNPVLGHDTGQYEGYAWMGVGLIVLCLILIVCKPTQILGAIRKHIILSTVLVGLFVFSLSNIVYVGSHKLIHIELPESLLQILNTFRSSGRFFWPILYTILSGTVVLIWKSFSKKSAILIMLLGTVLQLADMRLFMTTRAPSPYPKQSTEISKRELLEKLIQSHDRIILLPNWDYAVEGNRDLLKTFYVLASYNNKPISSSHLGRSFNPRTLSEDRHLYLSDGFREDSLYLFAKPLLGEVEALMLDPTLSQTRQLDDLLLLSKSMDKLEANHPELKELLKAVKIPAYKIGDKIDLQEPDSRRHFSGLQPSGRWTIDKTAHLALHILDPQDGLSLNMKAIPFISEDHLSQEIRFYIGNKHFGTEVFNSGDPVPWDINMELPDSCIDENNLLSIRMEFPHACSPKSLGQSEDNRTLALQIDEVSIVNLFHVLPLNSTVEFASHGTGSTYTLTGFSGTESEGIWTHGRLAKIAFRIPAGNENRSTTLRINANPFINGHHPELKCLVIVNGIQVLDQVFSIANSHHVLSIPLDRLSGKVSVEFHLDNPASPASLGIGQDTRTLGLYLRDMILVSAEDPPPNN